MPNEIEKAERGTEFIPYGAQDKVRLTVDIIKKLVAVPTRSGKTCSDRDAIKFIALCSAKRLNPFENDAYLIGYDSKDGVATFSLITAHQAFLKRAELHPEYDGMKSGIIVQNEDQTISDLEGDFFVDAQTVIGGWATVFFKTRKIPITRRLRLKRFQKPWGVWQEDPAGMICKCAEADALRSSFPTMLGGLFLREEIDLPMAVANGGPQDIPSTKLVEVSSTAVVDQRSSSPEPTTTQEAGKQGGSALATEELASFVVGEGYTFDQFKSWAMDSGNVPGIDDMPGFEAVPEKEAKRLLRAKAGLLKGLSQVKGDAL